MADIPLVSHIPPPDPSSTSAIPAPIPPSTTPPSIPNSKTLLAWAPLYLSKTDAVIEHLDAVLSTPAGTDNFLNAVCYTSLLASSLLRKSVEFKLHGTIKRAAQLWPKVTLRLGDSGENSRALGVAKRLKGLSGLISEIRTFGRLFGVIALWRWGRGVGVRMRTEDVDGRKDRIGEMVEASQVVVNVLYQVLENGAYLSERGILGWGKETQNWAWIWSSRFWGAHIGLDFLRLGRECLERRRRVGEGKKEGMGMGEEERRWWRQVIVDCAYAPLTVHWGIEGGIVSEFWVGVLGSVAGGMALSNAWRRTVV
ncbi:hypothetical protein BJ875DRAFT_94048 [Amylocarpus encephaloides]|uniref:Peroxin 11C n=1 Tax=Amylocarpus encephaloides TaxID=45428 RepID=A0A9P8C4L9_9HELO|nr:hypothetical protein BJ875DRAFT_94048 [Amylocarpus encephaloides]